MQNSTAGWAKPVWLAAGSPQYPSPAEIQDEMLASQPVAFQVAPAAGPANAFTVTLPPLEPYAVALVEVTYMPAATKF